VPSARTALLKKHTSIHNSQQINLPCFLFKSRQLKQEAGGGIAQQARKRCVAPFGRSSGFARTFARHAFCRWEIKL